jgi:hypothetical protein
LRAGIIGKRDQSQFHAFISATQRGDITVEFRMIVIFHHDWSNEQFRVLIIPRCERLDGRSMSDGLLWDEVIVRQEIVHQGLFKFSRAPETGLGRSSLMRPFMRSTMPFACEFEEMIDGRPPGSRAVGEFLVVVCHDRANVNRAGRLQALEEVQAAFFALVIVDMQEDLVGWRGQWRQKGSVGTFRRAFWADT